MENTSRVFATILPASGREFTGNEKEHGLEVRTVNRQTPGNRVREVQVTGTAEVCCPADRASVRVSVGNSKESVNEVTNSVSRRLEYILQSLRQHGICDKDTSVRRFLQREADLYHMGAEVVVTFSDFEKMERVCSVLLEKLDKSVCVGTPQFYHSPGYLSQLRKQACVSAVENAQQKASEVSQLLGQSLGPPLLVREEETREWRNEDEEYEGRGQSTAPFSHLPRTPTITASSRVSVSFSLRDRGRKKL
ncbi:LOW QUALITY PROTEIN: interleukin-1 receptor-associated kinase 1-binding protein 1 homolog [Lates calcarifer]|uniref:LOW QUALITY PROTEIN: interleukin-1 receptor-associated kinase 1-binding protein 1 homolog n=1 Tax=Lates calcarifer TaxID=8187 RepID=A0AAJ7QE18_LATCA|nr:LOW QUALITY PROTEIN: interleukin-1 receptor-associated kinase 1-binding protein 1 homolog [Lates calcarifer]